jgi:hypothetical protein
MTKNKKKKSFVNGNKEVGLGDRVAKDKWFYHNQESFYD